MSPSRATATTGCNGPKVVMGGSAAPCVLCCCLSGRRSSEATEQKYKRGEESSLLFAIVDKPRRTHQAEIFRICKKHGTTGSTVRSLQRVYAEGSDEEYSFVMCFVDGMQNEKGLISIKFKKWQKEQHLGLMDSNYSNVVPHRTVRTSSSLH